MTKFGPKLELPPEVRAVAEKNVNQAREAFDTLIENTRDVVDEGEGRLEEVRTGFSDLRGKAIGLMESNMEAGFDFLQKLVAASSPQEVLNLHAQFLTSQMQRVGEQAQILGSDAKSLGENTMNSFNEQARALAERVQELSAAAAKSAQEAAQDIRAVGESVVSETKANMEQAMDSSRKA